MPFVIQKDADSFIQIDPVSAYAVFDLYPVMSGYAIFRRHPFQSAYPCFCPDVTGSLFYNCLLSAFRAFAYLSLFWSVQGFFRYLGSAVAASVCSVFLVPEKILFPAAYLIDPVSKCPVFFWDRVHEFIYPAVFVI